jgi:hypothetical protein
MPGQSLGLSFGMGGAYYVKSWVVGGGKMFHLVVIDSVALGQHTTPHLNIPLLLSKLRTFNQFPT